FDGGIRDHAVITFDGTTPGPLERVSDDDAKLDACPHHGPSIAIAPDGTYHVTWFALGRKLKGLYYARSEDGGKHFSTPMPLGDGARQMSRPYVLAGADGVTLAYKTFDGERTTIEVKSSRDGGKTWSAAQVAAGTDAASDHPQLISDGKSTYLSWMSRNEGYRLIPLEMKSGKLPSAPCASCWLWALAQRKRRQASRGRSMLRAGAS
ncbi:MAG: sialidase family protein, partial [Hyphomicrobium sp.]|nr:sialidase family protein [Hyphomicrobium sp.]